MSINFRTQHELPGICKAALIWDCPECGTEVHDEIDADRDEIESDPLCSYCRARLKPEDERNRIVYKDGHFSRRDSAAKSLLIKPPPKVVQQSLL